MEELYFVCPECGAEETTVVPSDEVEYYTPTCPVCGEEMELDSIHHIDKSCFL